MQNVYTTHEQPTSVHQTTLAHRRNTSTTLLRNGTLHEKKKFERFLHATYIFLVAKEKNMRFETSFSSKDKVIQILRRHYLDIAKLEENVFYMNRLVGWLEKWGYAGLKYTRRNW